MAIEEVYTHHNAEFPNYKARISDLKCRLANLEIHGDEVQQAKTIEMDAVLEKFRVAKARARVLDDEMKRAKMIEEQLLEVQA